MTNLINCRNSKIWSIIQMKIWWILGANQVLEILQNFQKGNLHRISQSIQFDLCFQETSKWMKLKWYQKVNFGCCKYILCPKTCPYITTLSPHKSPSPPVFASHPRKVTIISSSFLLPIHAKSPSYISSFWFPSTQSWSHMMIIT